MSQAPTTPLSLEREVEAVPANFPHAIEVHEGNGERSLAASLAVTVAEMSERLAATPETSGGAAPVPTACADLKSDALELANDLDELIDLTVWQQDCVSRAAELLRKLADLDAAAAEVATAAQASN